MTNETFPARVDFDALEAVSQALASVRRVWPVEVWLETTLADAEEQTRQPRGCFEEVEGGVLLRVDVEDLPWMARLLAGVGVPFIVHRPRELCEVVREYARARQATRNEPKRKGASGRRASDKTVANRVELVLYQERVRTREAAAAL